MSDLNIEQKPSWRLWILAAVGALVLHVGGVALAVAHLENDDPDDSLGAPAIEVGLEMESPHLEATDLPAGPDADASVASPALAEQKAEVKEIGTAQGSADRNRGSRSGGGAERFE